MFKTSIALGLKLTNISLKHLIPLVLLLTLISLVVGCSAPAANTETNAANTTPASTKTPSASNAPTPKYGGVLKIVVRTPSNYFGYPGDMTGAGGPEVSMPCLENLARLDTKGQLDPSGLVTAYQPSPDGTSVILTLRKGVKFHDGTDFNATAVKWVLEAGKKARLAGTELIKSIEVVDDYSVKINVKHFDSRVFQAVSETKVSSPAAFEKYGEDAIHRMPVGTGPFKFVSFTPDIGVTWERFDDYWGGKPFLDGIKSFFIVDVMARSAALQSGDVDILFNVSATTALALGSKGYTVAAGNMPQLWALLPDSVNADSPLSKLEVRQSIEYAIDRNELAKLGNGFWQAANQHCEPSSPGYIPDFKGREYNVSKAKELLAQAGYPNGFDISIIYVDAWIPQDVMVAVQQMLSKVGIKVDVQPLTRDVRAKYSQNGWQNGFNVQNFYSGPTQYLSAVNYALGGSTYVSTARPLGWTEALSEAFYADPAGLDAACRKLNMVLYDNATTIPLYIEPQSIYAMSDYVHDAHLYESGNLYRWAPEKAWLSK